MLDDDNGIINEVLDGIDADTNKVATTNANDKEGDGVEPNKVKEGNEKKKGKRHLLFGWSSRKSIFLWF